CWSRMKATPSRKRGWSSTIAIWSVSAIALSRRPDRQRRDDPRTPLRPALDPELAAQTLDPLPHPEQPQVLLRPAHRRHVESRPRVCHLDPNRAVEAGGADSLASTVRVARGVGEGLLDDAIDGDFGRQGRLRGQIADLDLDLRPRPA